MGGSVRLRRVADRTVVSDAAWAWMEPLLPRSAGCRGGPGSAGPGAVRNAVDRGFGGLEQWRGLATRYDEHARNHAGALHLAALLAWLPCPSDTL
jgi:transposase